mmetsp:Transcript_27714/g.54407  ORF Transcript_27714/g.54407 Transcript_27714/m.54407 type:complete len:414 (-) Transcript_27714:30-1271(-)|eukprot:CAMPEP_0172714930 /NCGR_PEP_ID=MMETSP1074-20121228/67255_1 /TAXON_ID=2916 /ORGANISM="Ceratium fusus, Strain PA161109" /LENGTH=413 /DNA_ID=CAMNT_0013539459 /DNA_START=41 /DNA_END=1282 /DNA_ORIENTATION=-
MTTALEDSPDECHGRCFGFEGERSTWGPPQVVLSSDAQARPGYDSMSASEYVDLDDVFKAKVRVLAKLVQQAQFRIVYSGAGLSTAAGIDDYASRAEGSTREASPVISAGALGAMNSSYRSPFCAQPTEAHRALVAMYQAGLLQHWVNQNHDGLPQKAGLPQHSINEIHGAWHAPDNPVVPMTGELREDLISELRAMQQRADFVIAAGTSLCGMNADSLVAVPSERACAAEAGQLGVVIVGLQRTSHDANTTLRIFSRCDDVFRELARELGVDVPPPLPEGEFFVPSALAGFGDDDCVFDGIPYNAAGCRATEETISLDLRDGAELVITGGMHTGAVGELDGRDREGNFRCRFRLKPKTGKLRAPVAMLLGRWWVQAAVDGTVPRLPLVNKPPETASGQPVEQLRARMQAYAQ